MSPSRLAALALAACLIASVGAGCASSVATDAPGTAASGSPTLPTDTLPSTQGVAASGLLPTRSPAPSSSWSESPPAAAPLPQAAGYAARLQTQLAAAVTSLALPGAQATVVFADGSAWTGAAGYADLRTKRPMTAADVFEVGSITKTFVAAEVLRLAEAGVLPLDDRLSRWLPAYPNAARITLRQLLSHTSGLADYFANPRLLRNLGGAPRQAWRPEQLLVYVGRPAFAPGTNWAYSNTNYLLLGMVIRAATGRSLGAELTTRFLGPMGLDHTALQNGAEARPPLVGSLALPYEAPAKPKGSPIPLSDGSGFLPFTSLATALDAAGGLVSCSDDIARWGAALYGGRILRPDSLAAMEDVSISAPYKPHFVYGLGAQRLTFGSYTSFGHGGRCSGYRAVLRSFPALGVTIAVLTNVDGPDPDAIVAGFVSLLGGTPPRPRGVAVQ